MNKFVKIIALMSLMGITESRKVGSLAGLEPLLSHEARIYLPGSTGYADAITRWDASSQPGLDAIVKVFSEADVQHTVSTTANYSRKDRLSDLTT